VKLGKVDYDHEHDSVYVPVLDHRPFTEPATSSYGDDGVVIDSDEIGHVVGYEVHFLHRDGLEQRPSLPPEVVRMLAACWLLASDRYE
jgi:uncharacterized protein YuzE